MRSSGPGMRAGYAAFRTSQHQPAVPTTYYRWIFTAGSFGDSTVTYDFLADKTNTVVAAVIFAPASEQNKTHTVSLLDGDGDVFQTYAWIPTTAQPFLSFRTSKGSDCQKITVSSSAANSYVSWFKTSNS